MSKLELPGTLNLSPGPLFCHCSLPASLYSQPPATHSMISGAPVLNVSCDGSTTPTDFLAWREGWPGSVVGTRLDATVGYREAAYSRPTLILMGNEQAGLTDALAAACDVNVKIPMRGRADSLNLAIATGVMVYAVTDDL